MHREKAASYRLLHDERLHKALSVALVLALIVTAVLLRDRLPHYQSIGYVGIFVLSFLGSASILVPVPGIAAVCAGASPGLLGLFPLWVAILASVAESIGELSGYLLGFSGRGFAENTRIYPRVERWMQRQGWLALLLASSVPNPFFDFIGIAAGTLRYPVLQFLVAVWAGKLIKSMIIAYACFYGMGWALRVFGLD